MRRWGGFCCDLVDQNHLTLSPSGWLGCQGLSSYMEIGSHRPCLTCLESLSRCASTGECTPNRGSACSAVERDVRPHPCCPAQKLHHPQSSPPPFPSEKWSLHELPWLALKTKTRNWYFVSGCLFLYHVAQEEERKSKNECLSQQFTKQFTELSANHNPWISPSPLSLSPWYLKNKTKQTQNCRPTVLPSVH